MYRNPKGELQDVIRNAGTMNFSDNNTLPHE